MKIKAPGRPGRKKNKSNTNEEAVAAALAEPAPEESATEEGKHEDKQVDNTAETDLAGETKQESGEQENGSSLENPGSLSCLHKSRNCTLTAIIHQHDTSLD